MGRLLRGGLVGTTVLGVLGIVAVFSNPAHDLHYTTRVWQSPCSGGVCVGHYVLELGNTGTAPQEQVRVHLRRDALGPSFRGAEALSEGVRPLRMSHTETGGVRVYALGPLAPRQRVEIKFMLIGPTGLPPWGDLLVDLEADPGPVHEGAPTLITFGRVLWSLVAGVLAALL